MFKSTKLAIVGLSKAGKASIYKHCFENQHIYELENLPPTIGITRNPVELKYISKGISIWDFGGQETFRKSYLKDPNCFNETEIIIFVVDVTTLEELPEIRKYFSSIIKIFKKKELPKFFIFLHKCDPDKINQLDQNIAKIIIELILIFGNETPFCITSIYDDSACKALNQILFLSLPDEVLSKLFTLEMFEKLKKIISKKFENELPQKISEISEIVGSLLRKKLYNLWLDYPIKKIINYFFITSLK